MFIIREAKGGTTTTTIMTDHASTQLIFLCFFVVVIIIIFWKKRNSPFWLNRSWRRSRRRRRRWRWRRRRWRFESFLKIKADQLLGYWTTSLGKVTSPALFRWFLYRASHVARAGGADWRNTRCQRSKFPLAAEGGAHCCQTIETLLCQSQRVISMRGKPLLASTT